ncbi:MAG: T9SS type A sorting domain-containing protein, partial [Bacteroidota bacterium]|nr:T9SS type A sorting domain-containing protein [Bacteroidota bacterium]
ATTLTNFENPVAPTSVQATETEICNGSSTTLSYTGGSGDTFGWYTASCGGTSVGIGQNLSVSPTTTTTYYGRWETSGCGESTCRAITITVNPLPTAPSSVSATSTEICEGESTTLSYTGGSGDIFGWYTASCGGTSVGNGQNLSVNPTATTIYYGRWENICGASTCETVEITVNENIVADAGLDDSTCDEVYTMNANNPAPGMGSWSLLAGAATISNPDNPNTDITITSSPVTLRWTVVNGTCTTYDDVTITQSNATYIVSHPQDIIADEGTNANFSVTASGENLSFQWRKNGAELSDGGNISGATTNNLLVSNVTAADAGDYDVVVTGDCGTLTSDAAVLDVVTLRDELENFGISIYPNPTNDFVNITIDENVKSAKVNITTLSGRTIFKGGLVQGRVYELDMSDYASGVYLMSVQTKERVITVKLIKE